MNIFTIIGRMACQLNLLQQGFQNKGPYICLWVNPALFYIFQERIIWLEIYTSECIKNAAPGICQNKIIRGCMPPDPLARLRAYAAQICSLVMHRSDFRSGSDPETRLIICIWLFFPKADFRYVIVLKIYQICKYNNFSHYTSLMTKLYGSQYVLIL